MNCDSGDSCACSLSMADSTTLANGCDSVATALGTNGMTRRMFTNSTTLAVGTSGGVAGLAGNRSSNMTMALRHRMTNDFNCFRGVPTDIGNGTTTALHLMMESGGSILAFGGFGDSFATGKTANDAVGCCIGNSGSADTTATSTGFGGGRSNCILCSVSLGA